mgnify:CR=1 FL=1
MMALHDDTAPAPVDATTTTVVIGIADQVLGGGGWGLALRVEHQLRDHTAVGGEVTAGSGDRPGDDPGRIALVAVRGYGQSASPEHDFAAVTYGIGGGWMSTGMLTLNAFAAAANASFAPLNAFAAAANAPSAPPDALEAVAHAPFARPTPFTTAVLLAAWKVANPAVRTTSGAM